MALHRYSPTWFAAVEPRAIGEEFAAYAPAPPDPGAAITCVYVSGALCFSPGPLDTYAGIRARVQAALERRGVNTVVLVFDSPGGDVAGCFDCARGIRADAQAAGKALVAWVPTRACSAAYALAAACGRIVIADSAYVGSVGVIHELQSVVRQATAAGVDITVVTSGARKADGNPHVPITDEMVAATQDTAQALAGVFFGLVQAWRPGLDPVALQAGIVVGQAAVAAKLADEVLTLDELMTSLTGAAGSINATSSPSALSTTTENASNMPDEDKKPEDGDDDKKKPDAMLNAIAAGMKSEDPKVRARAARMAAAYDAEDAPADEKKDDASAVKAEAPADKKEEAAASLAKALSESHTRIAALESVVRETQAQAATRERAEFFASRPDLPAETVKSLEGLALDVCRRIVATVPVSRTFQSQSADFARQPVQGSAHESKEAFLKTPMAARMGLAQMEKVVVETDGGLVQSFGVSRVKQ